VRTKKSLDTGLFYLPCTGALHYLFGIDIYHIIVILKSELMKNMPEKRHYEKPVLEVCGSISERTLGNGGTSPDGRGEPDQKGYGND
jgi:hypothetical protein